MPLPPGFQFSQSSLQDYVDCRRRFELRYLVQLAWPAPTAEPLEEFESHARDGNDFHRLVHQHQLQLPEDRLAAIAVSASPDEEMGDRLAAWWQAYLGHPPLDVPRLRYPEVTLSAPVGDYRLGATYDLVAVEPGERAVIIDWKTSARRPKRAWLNARLQTRVYRYLLVRAGAELNPVAGQPTPLRPEQVSMRYWFAAAPTEPEVFPYDATLFEADERFLTGLIAEIAGAGDDLPLTSEQRRCAFCTFRSLCRRGVSAGEANDDEAAAEPEDATGSAPIAFDFEQAGEIAF